MTALSSSSGVLSLGHAPQRGLPCHERDVADLYFASDPTLLEQAKALCRECPLVVMCLEGALQREEPWGVWGGEIFADGRIVAAKRGRGRPRKQPRPHVVRSD